MHSVAEELCRVHGCHTVILYGSRARGDHREDSDYDVLGIREAGPAIRDARDWNGAYLDAFVYPEADLQVLEPGMERLLGGVVLCERDGAGRRLLALAEELAARPVEPLAADQHQMLVTWHRKTAARIRPQGPDDLEAHYRRAWLLHQALEDYFSLRALPFRGSKEAFRWLHEHDPEGWQAFKAALEPGAPEEAIDALVARVIIPGHGRAEDR